MLLPSTVERVNFYVVQARPSLLLKYLYGTACWLLSGWLNLSAREKRLGFGSLLFVHD